MVDETILRRCLTVIEQLSGQANVDTTELQQALRAAMTQPPSREPLQTQVEKFADLGPNWDSYGAEPLDPTVIERAARVAVLLGHLQAVPGADGSVSFEGHHGDDSIDISIEAGSASLYVHIDGFEYEANLPDPDGAGVTVQPPSREPRSGEPDIEVMATEEIERHKHLSTGGVPMMCRAPLMCVVVRRLLAPSPDPDLREARETPRG